MSLPIERALFNGVSVDPITRCWNWTRGKFSNGRGAIYVSHTRRNSLAHRVAYEIYKGPILPGLMVCHTCDNGICCNPAHLWLGTAADNMADMLAKGRQKKPTRPPFVYVRKGYRSGEAHHSTTLTAADVCAIRADTRSGRQIAKSYGISPSSVSMIRAGKRWKQSNKGEVI